MTAIAVRDAAQIPASSSTLDPVEVKEAIAANRRPMTATAATTPNAPTSGLDITSSRRARLGSGNGGSSPSALSTKPSMCSMPGRARSAATTIAAATAGGQRWFAPHHTPPSTSPMSAPTIGNQANDRRSGASVRPTGNDVRNASARLTGPASQVHHPAGDDQHPVVGDRGDGLVHVAQRVAEPTPDLAGRMHAE